MWIIDMCYPLNVEIIIMTWLINLRKGVKEDEKNLKNNECIFGFPACCGMWNIKISDTIISRRIWNLYRECKSIWVNNTRRAKE